MATLRTYGPVQSTLPDLLAVAGGQGRSPTSPQGHCWPHPSPVQSRPYLHDRAEVHCDGGVVQALVEDTLLHGVPQRGLVTVLHDLRGRR